jgi:hypothetical protein
MNDVTFIEAARFLGQRMIREGGPDSASRLRYGFRLVTGQTPSAKQEQILHDSFQYHLDYFSGKPEQTEALLNQGDSHYDPSLNSRELAAYASVGSLLLNLDKTITKE